VEFFDDDGDPYYYNVATQDSVRDRPAETETRRVMSEEQYAALVYRQQVSSAQTPSTVAAAEASQSSGASSNSSGGPSSGAAATAVVGGQASSSRSSSVHQGVDDWQEFTAEDGVTKCVAGCCRRPACSVAEGAARFWIVSLLVCCKAVRRPISLPAGLQRHGMQFAAHAFRVLVCDVSQCYPPSPRQPPRVAVRTALHACLSVPLPARPLPASVAPAGTTTRPREPSLGGSSPQIPRCVPCRGLSERTRTRAVLPGACCGLSALAHPSPLASSAPAAARAHAGARVSAAAG